MVCFCLSGSVGFLYWLFDDSDVGVVVFIVEFVWLLELVLLFGVFVCDRYWIW